MCIVQTWYSLEMSCFSIDPSQLLSAVMKLLNALLEKMLASASSSVMIRMAAYWVNLLFSINTVGHSQNKLFLSIAIHASNGRLFSAPDNRVQNYKKQTFLRKTG